MQLPRPYINSVLALDVGSIWTRSLLIDRVEGQYRVVAAGSVPTTIAPPHLDLMVGVRAAIRAVEAAAYREIVDSHGQIITPEDVEERGVDLLVTTTSAARPLKVAIGGLADLVSTASARRAARSTCSKITHRFSLDSHRGRWGNPAGISGVVEQLVEQWPDVILLAGGVEGSADRELLELVEAIALALEAMPGEEPPPVIWGGNSLLASDVMERLRGLTGLVISDNIRPSLVEETVKPAARLLAQHYRARCMGHLPGYSTLESWSGAVEPASEALARVVQYLSLREQKPVLGVDMGGNSATLATAFGGGETQSVVRADLGLARYVDGWIDQVSLDQLVGWVPGDSEPTMLLNHYWNHALHPVQHPMEMDTLRLLQGAAREVLRLLVAEAAEAWPPASPGFDIILGTGGAIRLAPRPEQALMILLDGLQPTGITRLFRDRIGVAAAAGAIASAAPAIADGLVEAQGFESLGTVIAPSGQAAGHAPILRFRLEQNAGSTEGTVENGQLYRFPVVEETRLILHPLPEIDLGRGPGEGVQLVSQGDTVGFVIDARGRPLPLPAELLARRAQVEEWLSYAGA